MSFYFYTIDNIIIIPCVITERIGKSNEVFFANMGVPDGHWYSRWYGQRIQKSIRL